jgi:hypothetical protein
MTDDATPEDTPGIRLIGSRRMQCKDIPDAVFMAAVLRTPGASSTAPGAWRRAGDVKDELEAVLGPIPENLFRAKARSLYERHILGGCPCGCRGDFHPVEHCIAPGYCCRQKGRRP